jgi:hypothetical protein
LELSYKIIRFSPKNAVVLPNVEMQIGNIIVATGPNYWHAEAHGNSRFEVHTASMADKVRD